MALLLLEGTKWPAKKFPSLDVSFSVPFRVMSVVNEFGLLLAVMSAWTGHTLPGDVTWAVPDCLCLTMVKVNGVLAFAGL